MSLPCSLSERGPGEGVRVSMTSSRGLATAAMLLLCFGSSGVDFVWKNRSRERALVVVEVVVEMELGVVERERAGREDVTL